MVSMRIHLWESVDIGHMGDILLPSQRTWATRALFKPFQISPTHPDRLKAGMSGMDPGVQLAELVRLSPAERQVALYC